MPPCLNGLCDVVSRTLQALTPRGRRVELREPVEVAWLAQVGALLVVPCCCLDLWAWCVELREPVKVTWRAHGGWREHPKLPGIAVLL